MVIETMKYTSLLLASIWLLLLGRLEAAPCELRGLAGASAEVSVLGLVMGNYPHYGAAAMDQAAAQVSTPATSWEMAFASEFYQLQGEGSPKKGAVLLSEVGPYADLLADSSQWGTGYFYEGVLQMLGANFDAAVGHFNDAEIAGGLSSGCKLVDYRLMAQYFDQYGISVPIFSGFNNGFYNFACDSLRLKRAAPDPVIYERLVSSVMDLVILSQQPEPFMEILGDLLSQHPDRVTANWFPAIIYHRLAFDIPAQEKRLKEKSIFALEAPRRARQRFDNYQFVQLGERLAEDLNLAEESWNGYLNEEKAAVEAGKRVDELLKEKFGAAEGGLLLMRENEPGALPNVIREADRRTAEQMGEQRKFAGKVDLKKVKGEQKFNYYAIVMIAVVIGSVIFIWRQLKKNAR